MKKTELQDLLIKYGKKGYSINYVIDSKIDKTDSVRKFFCDFCDFWSLNLIGIKVHLCKKHIKHIQDMIKEQEKERKRKMREWEKLKEDIPLKLKKMMLKYKSEEEIKRQSIKPKYLLAEINYPFKKDTINDKLKTMIFRKLTKKELDEWVESKNLHGDGYRGYACYPKEYSGFYEKKSFLFKGNDIIDLKIQRNRFQVYRLRSFLLSKKKDPIYKAYLKYVLQHPFPIYTAIKEFSEIDKKILKKIKTLLENYYEFEEDIPIIKGSNETIIRIHNIIDELVNKVVRKRKLTDVTERDYRTMLVYLRQQYTITALGKIFFNGLSSIEAAFEANFLFWCATSKQYSKDSRYNNEGRKSLIKIVKKDPYKIFLSVQYLKQLGYDKNLIKNKIFCKSLENYIRKFGYTVKRKRFSKRELKKRMKIMEENRKLEVYSTDSRERYNVSW